jgi:hypothetical protein
MTRMAGEFKEGTTEDTEYTEERGPRISRIARMRRLDGTAENAEDVKGRSASGGERFPNNIPGLIAPSAQLAGLSACAAFSAVQK